MDYTKQPLEYAQIPQQLKSRGLLFHDEQAAENELKIVSYFRLANYLRTFEKPHGNHQFLPNSYFEDAVCIYYFDKDLRALIFTAIQSIEIALRSKVIHYVALKHGAFWFANESLCVSKSAYHDNLEQIKKEIKRSKEDFIQEHFAKYDNPDVPPVWKALEVTSFGVLSKLICNLNDVKVKKRIAHEFNLPQHLCLESWIRSVVVLRNCLAHHARVWNRRFSQMPSMSYKMRGKWVDVSHVRSAKLYSLLCCLAYLQDNIHPDNDFKDRLKQLLSRYPNVNLHAMGFPSNWKEQPLWK